MILNKKIYPWQQPTWLRLQSMRNRLPHALLLRGKAGLGKLDFAEALAQALLCSVPVPDGFACGQCPSCTWLKEDAHPDFRLISPEHDIDPVSDESVGKKSAKKSMVIKIEQIRELNDFLGLSNHQHNSFRIVLIAPAEALNIASANALLKMLEEPPKNTVFILVSNQPQRLLPTILSRCQIIDMQAPSEIEAIKWLDGQGVKLAPQELHYAGGSPLLALEQAQNENSQWMALAQLLATGSKLNPATSVSFFLANSMDAAIVILQKWCCDLLSSKLTHQVRYHTQQIKSLQDLSKSVNLRLLLKFQVKLLEARKMAHHPLNNELQLESILLQYTQIFSHRVR